MIFETLSPSCNEDVNFKYKFNGHMTRVKWKIIQIIIQWQIDLESSMSTNVLN